VLQEQYPDFPLHLYCLTLQFTAFLCGEKILLPSYEKIKFYFLPRGNKILLFYEEIKFYFLSMRKEDLCSGTYTLVFTLVVVVII